MIDNMFSTRENECLPNSSRMKKFVEWLKVSCRDFVERVLLIDRNCFFFLVSNCTLIYTQKSFRNLIDSNGNQIEFSIFRLIWNQTVVRLVPNQSLNDKFNLISVSFKKISLCVEVHACTIIIVGSKRV